MRFALKLLPAIIEGMSGSKSKSVVAGLRSAGAAAAGCIALLVACGSDSKGQAGAPVAADASVDRAVATPQPIADAAELDATKPDASPLDAATFDAGPCNARIDTFAIAASPHVPDGTPIVYSSNPPSSGPHYGTWANFQELTHPVDDGYLVHSMEHGAVLLLYQCQAQDAACDALVAELRAVRDALPADPLCDPSIRVRVVIAPRAANGVTVAAAAWGSTYRADCVDAASLSSFVLGHYAKGTENTCAAGQVF